MNQVFSSRYFYVIPCLSLLSLWLLVKNDPFFGDAISSTSRAAVHIYENNLQTIFYPADHDPGHPTLYAWLLAALWKITGKSLAVAHAFSILWLGMLLFVFRKIARLYLADQGQVNKALLLFIAMPTVLSQGAMMLNTLAVMTFFMTAVYGLLARSNRWFLPGAVLMMITHLQAPFFLLSLAVTDLVLSWGKIAPWTWVKQRWFLYTIPFVVFVLWLWTHHQHTGWFVQSPQYSDADQLNGFSQFIKGLLLICWRLADFGMLPCYMVFGFALVKGYGSKVFQKSWIALALTTALPMAFFLENTIGHRYFLAFGLLMIIAACDVLWHIEARAANVLYLVLLLSLVAGNFLYYPGKNMGDGNLAYRAYFGLQKEVECDFSGTVFYSHAPIANPPDLTLLESEGMRVQRINETPFDSLPAILQSNVNAEFSEADKQYLTTHFYGKSYERGAVFINVFLNPKYYQKPEGWKLREPSWLEACIIGLKKKAGDQ